MAPALTQASESPDLTDATRHSLPPKAITNIGSPHEHIKTLNESHKSSLESVLIERSVLISNGDCFSYGLAPPACGRAEGRPEPNSLPSQFNMEEFTPETISRNSGDQGPRTISQNISVSEINMGLQTCLRNISTASEPNAKGSKVVTSNLPNEDAQPILQNPNDFLALMGQDFNNVNEIMDTLQNFASNPELLDATARDLEITAIPQCSVARDPIVDRKSIALNHLLDRQYQLERRRNFLACRLNRITARGLGVTISNELSYLIKYSRSIVEKDKTSSQRASLRSKSKLESFHCDSMKSMTTSDLISLVKRVEANSNRRENGKNVSNISLPSMLRSEIGTIVSEWKSASFSHVNHDSDATESSSGGESCDENEQFNKINIEYKPIRQRAFYKYCKKRGWIASKWMWLQAQIADLDNKIANEQKIHTKVTLEEGHVNLLDRTGHTKEQRSPADLDMQDPALTCIASPLSTRTMINGYHPNSKLANVTLSMQNLSGETGMENECARTAGVLKIKRQKYVNLKKILRQKSSENVCQQSDTKYNDKPFTTAHCNCSPPLSCILCLDSSFHSSKTVRISCDNLCDQSIKQKLAVIDSSFHPVLSTKPGVLQSETYNKLLRSWEWHRKAFKGKLPVKSKSSNLSSNNLHLNEDTDDESRYEMPSKKRRRELKRNGKRTREDRPIGHRVTRRNHGSSFDDDEDELSSGWAVGSSHSSPCPSPGLERSAKCDKTGTESKGEGRSRKHSVSTSVSSVNNNAGSSNHRFKQSSNSYDINNIVIPCMAAPPRLETIKYKEIPTPKWRIIDIEPLNASNSFNLEEDICDDAINARHSRSEAMEHKKFLQYLQINKVNSTRSSRSRRTDSSGTNTPDHPLSPRALENSPAGSPPGTPLMTPSEDSLPPASDIASSDQTVLTLSLSSLLNSQKPIELTNPEINTSCAEVVHSNKLEIPNPKSSLNSDGQDPKPALRARRILSGHSVERSLRSTSINSIVEEQDDRKSPFPSRDFPLTESVYQVLVTESSTSRESSSSSSKSRREHVDNVVEVSTINELESGPRDSPLSELTDSALEEDVTWEDESTSTPDWTISAVHDHSGGFVLQVQKN